VIGVIDHGEHSYRGRGRLAGVTALVTDADSGLGRAAAIALAREGADVALSHLGCAEGTAETRAWVEDAGRRAVVFEADPSTVEGRTALVDRAVRELGRIQVVVINTAFEWLRAAAGAADVTERERAYRTSLESAFQFALAMSAHVDDGGAIILTAPMRHAHPLGPTRALAASTNAFEGNTASLAHTLSSKRIRVNAIVPGPVSAPRILAHLPPDAVSRFGSETLPGRAAQPAELAPAYVFLAASAESGFVNGATLEVTGGVSAPPRAFE
jgi:NAD(P)-dependent dehydrogenase (short-subunit alcohol dehydrogenase family)